MSHIYVIDGNTVSIDINGYYLNGTFFEWGHLSSFNIGIAGRIFRLDKKIVTEGIKFTIKQNDFILGFGYTNIREIIFKQEYIQTKFKTNKKYLVFWKKTTHKTIQTPISNVKIESLTRVLKNIVHRDPINAFLK